MRFEKKIKELEKDIKELERRQTKEAYKWVMSILLILLGIDMICFLTKGETLLKLITKNIGMFLYFSIPVIIILFVIAYFIDKKRYTEIKTLEKKLNEWKQKDIE